MSQLTPVFLTQDNEFFISSLEFREQELNLSTLQRYTPYVVRIYRSEDKLTLDGSGFWLIAEIALPGIAYHTEPVLDEFDQPILDENGMPETRSIRTVLTENDIDIVYWQLPEGD